MASSRSTRTVVTIGIVSMLALALAGCNSMTFGPSTETVQQEPQPEPEIPPTIRPDELVGRWGLASYHKPDDRVRTENAARGQCRQPYVIGKGPTGGVIMHLADEATPQELRVKGSRSGKNYIGPAGPAGGDQDREIVSFDGRVLTTRFLNADANSRYGTMVYVRCAPRA